MSVATAAPSSGASRQERRAREAADNRAACLRAFYAAVAAADAKALPAIYAKARTAAILARRRGDADLCAVADEVAARADRRLRALKRLEHA